MKGMVYVTLKTGMGGWARGDSILFSPGLGTLEPWRGLWS